MSRQMRHSSAAGHTRRKFIEAKQAQPKGKSGKADMALNHIQKLYGIEKQISELALDEKLRIRQQKAMPELTKLKTWLDKSSLEVPPQSSLGKAITYSLNQWPKLIRYGSTSVESECGAVV